MKSSILGLMDTHFRLHQSNQNLTRFLHWHSTKLNILPLKTILSLDYLFKIDFLKKKIVFSSNLIINHKNINIPEFIKFAVVKSTNEKIIQHIFLCQKITPYFFRIAFSIWKGLESKFSPQYALENIGTQCPRAIWS